MPHLTGVSTCTPRDNCREGPLTQVRLLAWALPPRSLMVVTGAPSTSVRESPSRFRPSTLTPATPVPSTITVRLPPQQPTGLPYDEPSETSFHPPTPQSRQPIREPSTASPPPETPEHGAAVQVAPSPPTTRAPLDSSAASVSDSTMKRGRLRLTQSAKDHLQVLVRRSQVQAQK